MTNNNLTAGNTNIVGIQLNLFDCWEGMENFDTFLNKKITGDMNLDLENNVILTSSNHFEFDNRRCPRCGKISLIKKKFVKTKSYY